MNCPYCGEKNENDARFCVNCGASLIDRAFECVYAAPAPGFRGIAASLGKTSPRKWPAVIPVLMGAALVLEIMYAVIYAGIARAYGFSWMMVIGSLVSTALVLLALGLFIAPTRPQPIVTAIPRIIGVVWTLIMLFFSRPNVLSLLIVLVPAALYIVGAAVKPRSPALAVIHLVLTVVVFVLVIFSFDYLRLNSADKLLMSIAVGNAVSGASGLLSGIGYSVAMFYTRRKYFE